MDEYIEYESMVFSLGGDMICQECNLGFLIPDDNANPIRLRCEICDAEFEIVGEAIDESDKS